MTGAALQRAVARWSGKRAVVVGAGRSGVAAARLLERLGARVILTDRREAEELSAIGAHIEILASAGGADQMLLAGTQIRIQPGGHPDSLWPGTDAVIASPGIAPDAPPFVAARAQGLEPMAEIEMAAALAQAPFIGITGSNGKSTVTAMVGAILDRSGLDAPLCGNIGVPMSRVVLDELEGARVDCYVAELSSFQTEQIVDFHPRWAAILNLSADHLDRHRTLDAYGAAKLGLVRNCGANDFLVYGLDDPWLVDHLPARPIAVPFSSAPVAGRAAGPGDAGRAAAWIDGTDLWWRDPAGAVIRVMALADLRVVGQHNALNACAAVAVACLAGSEPAAAASALREFSGLEHRMEPCGSVRGVLCINDSKATNVGATAAALAGLEQPTWLILGGRDKSSEFERLRPLLDERIRGVLLIGEAAERIRSALDDAVETQLCGDLEAAIDAALEVAVAGEVLLLAPACTSFDQFDDFEHRGRCFKELVAARAARVTSGS